MSRRHLSLSDIGSLLSLQSRGSLAFFGAKDKTSLQAPVIKSFFGYRPDPPLVRDGAAATPPRSPFLRLILIELARALLRKFSALSVADDAVGGGSDQGLAPFFSSPHSSLPPQVPFDTRSTPPPDDPLNRRRSVQCDDCGRIFPASPAGREQRSSRTSATLSLPSPDVAKISCKTFPRRLWAGEIFYRGRQSDQRRVSLPFSPFRAVHFPQLFKSGRAPALPACLETYAFARNCCPSFCVSL